MPFKSLSSLVEDAATLQGYSTKYDFSDNLFEYIPVTNSDGLLCNGNYYQEFTKLRLQDLVDFVANEKLNSNTNAYLTLNSDGRLDITSDVVISTNYVKTATGLIFCWGVGTRTTEGTETVTFPITFPHACLNVLLSSKISNDASSHWYSQIISWNTSSFTWQMQIDDSSSSANGCYYLAVGW